MGMGERRQRYVRPTSCFDTVPRTNLSALGDFTVSLDVRGTLKKTLRTRVLQLSNGNSFLQCTTSRVYLGETSQKVDIHGRRYEQGGLDSLQQLART